MHGRESLCAVLAANILTVFQVCVYVAHNLFSQVNLTVHRPSLVVSEELKNLDDGIYGGFWCLRVFYPS